MIIKKLEIGLALSDRKDGLKYSVYVGKEEAEALLVLGERRYAVRPAKSKTVVASLVPVSDEYRGDAFALQVKTGGQCHMEFPVSLTGKEPVGVKGKGCRTEAWIFQEGHIQLRRPSNESLLKAYAHREFSDALQLKLIGD